MRNIIEDRVYWKEIKGSKILFADYSYATEETLFGTMKKHVNTCLDYASNSNKKLLTISIFKQNPIPDYCTLKTSQIIMASSNLNKISVITGMTELQEAMAKSVSINQYNPFVFKCSVNDSIDYILKHNDTKVSV